VISSRLIDRENLDCPEVVARRPFDDFLKRLSIPDAEIMPPLQGKEWCKNAGNSILRIEFQLFQSGYKSVRVLEK